MNGRPAQYARLAHGWLGQPLDVRAEHINYALLVPALIGLCQKYPHLLDRIMHKARLPDRRFMEDMLKRKV